MAHAGKVTYVYSDPQGTPLAEADANGNITARFDYTPYGESVPSMGAAPNGVGYTGHVNDPETGLVYMQAPYYDPVVGLFLSHDPAGRKAGFNDYAYVGNNSINKIDPIGMFECNNKASCDAGTRLRADFQKAQQHYKRGSPAYKSLEAGIKALGTANDGGAIQVVLTSDPTNAAAGNGAYDAKKNTRTLTFNQAQLDMPGYTNKQKEAEFAATGRHEMKHIEDDVAAGHKPHDVADEFWHEVRGIRAETPIWQGMGVDDPLKTWTSNGGVNMQEVYKSAQWSTNYYCPGGTCP